MWSSSYPFSNTSGSTSRTPGLLSGPSNRRRLDRPCPDLARQANPGVSAFRLGTSPAHEMDDHKMYYGKRELWPLLVRAGFKPSCIRLSYQKLGMTLFGRVQK